MAAETFERILADVKTAMRAKDRQRTTALRMFVSVLKNEEIKLRRDLTEDDILGLLSTEAKKRREAATAFRDGGRDELADKEIAELGLIEAYLPAPLTEDEVAALVTAAIAEVGAQTPRDMGKVMGKVMPQIKGRFDGGALKDIVLGKLR